MTESPRDISKDCEVHWSTVDKLHHFTVVPSCGLLWVCCQGWGMCLKIGNTPLLHCYEPQTKNMQAKLIPGLFQNWYNNSVWRPDFCQTQVSHFSCWCCITNSGKYQPSLAKMFSRWNFWTHLWWLSYKYLFDLTWGVSGSLTMGESPASWLVDNKSTETKTYQICRVVCMPPQP